MKNTIIFFLFFTLLSCTKTNNISQIKDVNVKDSSSEMISYLRENYGFTGDIESTDEYIIVDNEILFSKSHFWEEHSFMYESNGNGSPNGQKSRRQQYKVTSTKVVLVSVPNNIPSIWIKALNNAMSEWNKLNGGIRFSGISSNEFKSNAVNVRMTYLVGNGSSIMPAQGFPVSRNGRPGERLDINTNYKISLNISEATMIMVHELGHCIGFYHTDTHDGTLINTSYSTCNTKNDPNSVMRKTYTTWNGFTDCDKAAFFAMYP